MSIYGPVSVAPLGFLASLMRGGVPGPAGRGGRRPKDPLIRGPRLRAVQTSLTAPYRGWNARGNLANMRPEEAIQLDNIFPGVLTTDVRKGKIDWKTAAPATIHSLLPYSGLTANKLFAATNAGIYDVTTAGAFGAAAVACTNGFWQSVMMATAGGNFLFAVNGTDSAKTYDGASWAVPAITVATSSTWNYVAIHKKRIWAIQKDTTDLWYLPVESIAGAATKFPVGSLFKKGGKLVAIGAWSLDSGSGLDDYFVIVTSNGEIAVYQGTDPASSSTWALVGVYDVARPLGTRPLIDYGGDLLYLSQVGLIPLSKVRQSVVLDSSAPISFNIDGAFIEAAADYANNAGWQMLLHKAVNLLIINVPVSPDVLSYQFVMNTITKKWCRFTAWNASCWAELGGEIYFGGALTVCKAWSGDTDSGSPIVGTCVQAYANYGMNGQKNITLVRPNFSISGTVSISLSFDADYNTFSGSSSDLSYAPATSSSIWDTSLWDSAIWGGSVSVFPSTWLTIPGNLGKVHSLRMQITASTGGFSWISTDVAFRPAGIL
jgi:hypothetical protein